MTSHFDRKTVAMFCPSCGTQNDPAANYCAKCGVHLRAGANGAPAQAFPAIDSNGGPIYAGFWKRLVAYVLDWVVLYVAFVVATFALGPVLGPGLGPLFGQDVIAGPDFARPRPWVFLLQVTIPWLYYALMESSVTQATLGKMALGIKVVDLTGKRISFLRATGRFFGQIVSSMIFCIGYLMAGFTRRKQALHDMMAGCLVVNKRYAAGDLGTPPSRRRLSGGLLALIVIVALVLGIGIASSIAIPAYRDYAVRSKVADMAAVGNAATRAINDYYVAHQALPDDLGATRFSLSSPHVESVAFDRQSRTVVVTANFAPIQGQRLLYAALSPDEAPRIVWRCASGGIPNRYLPTNCRSVTTRL